MRITTESNGDTIRNPLLKDSEGKLISFDIIVANPPFSLENWGRDYAETDPFGRFNYGIPSEKFG